MAIVDNKITEQEIIENRIRSDSAPDRLVGLPDDNKKVFDRLALLIASRFNSSLDSITNTFTEENQKIATVKSILEDEIDSITKRVNPLIPKGIYETLADLQEAHPTGETGDSWLIGTYESNSVYIWDEDQESWANAGGLIDANGYNNAFNRSFESEASNLNENGVADVGILDTIPRADHVHPSDTSKADLVSGFVDDAELLDSTTITIWNTILGIS